MTKMTILLHGVGMRPRNKPDYDEKHEQLLEANRVLLTELKGFRSDLMATRRELGDKLTTISIMFEILTAQLQAFIRLSSSKKKKEQSRQKTIRKKFFLLNGYYLPINKKNLSQKPPKKR